MLISSAPNDLTKSVDLAILLITITCPRLRPCLCRVGPHRHGNDGRYRSTFTFGVLRDVRVLPMARCAELFCAEEGQRQKASTRGEENRDEFFGRGRRRRCVEEQLRIRYGMSLTYLLASRGRRGGTSRPTALGRYSNASR